MTQVRWSSIMRARSSGAILGSVLVSFIFLLTRKPPDDFKPQEYLALDNATENRTAHNYSIVNETLEQYGEHWRELTDGCARNCALFIIGVHPCNKGLRHPEWANLEVFLKFGYLDLNQLRIVKMLPNVHFVYTPQFFADLPTYGYVAKLLADHNRWFQRYKRFLIFNTGARGPIWDPHLSDHWLDAVSDAAILNPSLNANSRANNRITDPEQIVICSSLSRETSLHCQSYFLSLSASAAKVLLMDVYQLPQDIGAPSGKLTSLEAALVRHRRKTGIIRQQEIGGSVILRHRGFVLYSLALQLRSDIGAHVGMIPLLNPYLHQKQDGKKAIFVKYGGAPWPEQYPESTMMEIEQRTNELLLLWTATHDDGGEAPGMKILRWYLKQCFPTREEHSSTWSFLF